MKNLSLFPILVLSFLAISCQRNDTATDPVADSEDTVSPYAGQESRQIKSLSDDEIDGLISGSGMGYAKVAELNGFPGPKHVLELATQLDLTSEQQAQTASVMETMQARAKALGAELVEAERELDMLFAGTPVDSAAAHEAMRRAAKLEAELRWTHVSAHLSQVAILSPEQRHQYVSLRGYHEMGGHQHGAEHQHQM